MPIISERITVQRRSCRELARLAKACLLLIGVAFSANSQGPIVDVVVSSETVPAGGTAQIKFSLARPQAIASGALSIDLDPEFFGDVIAASAFGAAGDVHGWATITGRHVEVDFASASGTIGVVNGLPVVTVTAPILPGQPEGSKVRVNADPGSSPWRNAEGIAYAGVRVAPGTQTVGGTLSIREVQPSTGILLAGTKVRVLGTGFTASSVADIEGASVASVEFAGPEQIDITLAAPTEITGKRVRLRNPDDSAVDFFPAWSGDPVVTSPADPFADARPILPLYASTFAESGGFARNSVFLIVQNPNLTPVEVAIQSMSIYEVVFQEVRTIPAGAAVGVDRGFSGGGGRLRVLASAPVRSEALYYGIDRYTREVSSKGSTSLFPRSLAPIPLLAGPDPIAWTWTPGAAKPAPQALKVWARDAVARFSFSVSATTDSGGNWLSVDPPGGTAFASGSGTPSPIAVLADPASLAPGIYRGTITITPETFTYQTIEPAQVAVALTVSSSPFVNTVACCPNFQIPVDNRLSESYLVSRDIIPGTFSSTVVTYGGGNWLSVRPSGGTSPAQITVTADPVGVTPGRYSGEVLITGSGNTIYMPVTFEVLGGVHLIAGTGEMFKFAAEPGRSPPPQVVTVWPICSRGVGCTPSAEPAPIPWTSSVRTQSGGNWLSATRRSDEVVVSVDSASLAPGLYTGAVTLTSAAAGGPTQTPVVLMVGQTGPVPALTANPTSLNVRTTTTGESRRILGVCVKAGESVVKFSMSASTTDGGDWLGVPPGDQVTMSCPAIGLNLARLAVGTYTGKVTVTAAGQSLSIPIKLTVDRPSQSPPVLGSVVSAASAMPGAIAPGEIVTIRGMDLGPIVLAGYPPPSLDPPRVFFDGIPAPVLYASAPQVNAVVPEQLAGKTAATLELQYGYLSAVWGVPMAAAAPGIFTLDSSGQGPAAVLNQDNSVNGFTKPAPRGSVIQIFATGIGERQQVTVAIGGIDAEVTFAGPAPGSVAGLFQVNAIVPPEVTVGPVVPIVLAVGPYRSQDGVTIAVD